MASDWSSERLLNLPPKTMLAEISRAVGRALDTREELAIAVLALMSKAHAGAGLYVLGNDLGSGYITFPKYLKSLGYPTSRPDAPDHDEGVYECNLKRR